MKEKIWIGIDGGGTKTVALAARRDGTLAATARAGSINYFSVGWEEARAQLRAVINSIEKATEGASIASVYIGNAALADAADPAELQRLTEGVVAAERIAMESDLCAALESMQTDGAAAVAISGTGSMAAGRVSPGAPLLTAGGWGYLLGDEGSGFHLAWEGVRAALRGFEKSAEPTALTDALFSHFGVRAAADLVPLFYEPPMERHRMAEFARMVLSCAAAEDAVACAIVARCAQDFARTTAALLRRLPDHTQLGLWGGVLCGSAQFRAAFTNALASTHPALRPALLPCPPEAGALFAAFRQSAQPLSAVQRKNLIITGEKAGWVI